MPQFKPLTHTQDTEYVLVSGIDDLDKIEARATNSYTGDHYYDLKRFMLELIVKDGQLQSKPSSLLLRKFIGGDMVVLGEATYMLGNLIIEDMTVVRKVKVPD